MSRSVFLATLVALFGTWTAAPVSAVPQKVEEVKKTETREEASPKEGQEAGADREAGSGSEDSRGEGKEGAAKPRKPSGTDVALLRQVANEEGRFRQRTAQIKRARAVAQKKGDEKVLERIAALEEKNQSHYEKRMSELREKHGAEQVDAAMARIEKAGKGLKQGKGGAKAKELRKKAGEKAQKAKEQDKAKAKDKWQKAKNKKKETEGGNE